MKDMFWDVLEGLIGELDGFWFIIVRFMVLYWGR